MERRETDIERDPATGQVHEHRRITSDDPVMPANSSSEVVSTTNPGWRAVQLIYLVFGVIDGLLLIRMMLKLLGANPHAGFSNWLYNVTDVFLAPFRNLLPTIGNEQSQLEMSVVVAILVYALIGWAVARLFAIVFYRNITVARRSGGMRPRGY
ncbi:MAG: YggT family protein [Chloroflexi bacterium]|nr:MAG: YggT family protein [Chloroflexota bacterium]